MRCWRGETEPAFLRNCFMFSSGMTGHANSAKHGTRRRLFAKNLSHVVGLTLAGVQGLISFYSIRKIPSLLPIHCLKLISTKSVGVAEEWQLDLKGTRELRIPRSKQPCKLRALA